MNELNKKQNTDNKKVYQLQENLNDFGINKIFITKFLTALWNYPEAIYHILNHSNARDIKTSLAPLIVDNFFTNNLSGNYIENNLLYILTLMLKDEVDKLKDLEEVETFLDNTRCGYLLEELQKKPDIQLFFNKVVLKTIEKMETFSSYKEMKFNVFEIDKELNKLKELYEKEELKSGKKNDVNTNEEIFRKIVNTKIEQNSNYANDESSYSSDIKDEKEVFVKKYIIKINAKEFENRAKKAKSENNKDLYNYFHRFEEDIKKGNYENMYANTNLMDNLLKTSTPHNILTLYRIDFMKIMRFIEQLINDLMENIILLPFSIKSICKIISILIRNKFKNITKAEENGFVAKFLLGRLLIPMISSPSFNCLISDFVISGNTLKNINVLNIILSKLFSGDLFKNNAKEEDYTPFNWFFMDNMGRILHFFEKATNVNLPNFIDKFINNNLPENYEYKFFEENKEEIYSNISICFNINYLLLLIEGVRKSPEIFEKNTYRSEKLFKAYEKLKGESIINELKKVDKKIIINNLRRRSTLKDKSFLKSKEKVKEKDSDAEYYYLHKDNAIEEKYDILFKLDNKIANFYIDLKKIEKKTKLNDEEKNIIKVKNYLSNSIGNFRLLNISDFQKESTSDTIKMLNEIKSYMALPNFMLNNNTIPSTWYIKSLLDCLNKIPLEYKKNDFEKLYKELKGNLEDSIDILDFQRLILFRNKLKFVDKLNSHYSKLHDLIRNISINETIKNIVENNFIPVEMTFKYVEEEDDNKFDLKPSSKKEKNFEDKEVIEDIKNKISIFPTVESFTTHFPNLTKYQLLQDKNPLEIIEELKIPDKLNKYFDIIKEKIIKNEKITEEQYDELYQEKIKNYIMNKIFERIYPIEPLVKDTQIFKKATMLTWVEPQIIVEKEYIYDNILPDILNQFKQIHIVKTPLKKLKCIREIFELIQSLIQFNEGENKTMLGSDDITPVLNYAFIKAAPFRIYTDLEFIKIFLEIKEGQGGYDINQLESAYTLLLLYNAESFKISPQEYKRRCQDAANDLITNK